MVMIRLNIGAAILLLSATSANSLQLSCELASGVDVVRTLKITVAADDKVNVWKRSEASTGLTFMPEHERNPKVLFHYKPNYMGPNTSVIVVENRDDERKDITYPPTIYIINWAKAKLAEVTVPAGTEPPGQVSHSWQCTRTD